MNIIAYSRLLELQKHFIFTSLFVLYSLVVLCICVALIWTIPCVVFAFVLLNHSIVRTSASSARLIAADVEQTWEPRFSARAPTNVCPLTAMSDECTARYTSTNV